ncbi:MAG: hypothetical protein GVY10_09925 [Verrucomicrobia bacterium]|jgi:hypothetical protein|nr:hypothetical protein [Verrucomicrobiota bacterium]
MTCSLSWQRRDEEGKRIQIEFKLVKEKAAWQVHRRRFEPREPYEPETEDWEELLAQMERNLRRGKVYPEDLRLVRRLYARWRE